MATEMTVEQKVRRHEMMAQRYRDEAALVLHEARGKADDLRRRAKAEMTKANKIRGT